MLSDSAESSAFSSLGKCSVSSSWMWCERSSQIDLSVGVKSGSLVARFWNFFSFSLSYMCLTLVVYSSVGYIDMNSDATYGPVLTPVVFRHVLAIGEVLLERRVYHQLFADRVTG